jgi:hypothetical protein
MQNTCEISSLRFLFCILHFEFLNYTYLSLETT